MSKQSQIEIKIKNFLDYVETKDHIIALFYHKHTKGFWKPVLARFDFGFDERHGDEAWIELYNENDLKLAIKIARKRGYRIINQDLIDDVIVD